MTRIKYYKTGLGNYISKPLKNFEGKTFFINIRPNDPFKSVTTLLILNDKGDVIFKKAFTDIILAKRYARNLMIRNFNVRLNDEIRLRK